MEMLGRITYWKVISLVPISESRFFILIKTGGKSTLDLVPCHVQRLMISPADFTATCHSSISRKIILKPSRWLINTCYCSWRLLNGQSIMRRNVFLFFVVVFFTLKYIFIKRSTQLPKKWIDIPHMFSCYAKLNIILVICDASCAGSALKYVYIDHTMLPGECHCLIKT